ncbi:structural protein [Synechococcus phage S-CAM3]|uniref:Structural protein n=1 Tax=Synechococcus phage S-CAM3 TaxID=1883366 RepID=A0A1D8KIX4_9CAUD|nr:structural protein [Synechococcus phage S-CAM3]
MNTQISSLIEDQLPGFIVAQYENFQKVLENYYEHLESPGNPLDIITNLTSYHDIDTYEKNLLQERTTLSTYLNSTATTIIVDDASSFPERNGYIKIDNEICFYKERTQTEFLEVSRGVSGTTQLGDLYSSSKFVNSESDTHSSGVFVDNLSNLFLYGIVKSFEKQYLESFPQDYLKKEVDKRTLIKNISNFYKVKGTDKSIRFIFNTIISKSADDVPTTYHPKNQTVKVSTSDWDSSYVVQAQILSGDPLWLIGETITQTSDNNLTVDYASAVVENVYSVDSNDGDVLYNLVINPQSVNSDFIIPQKTVLTRNIVPALTTGDTITVDSTFGWNSSSGVVVINGEVISYEGKSLRQFTIKDRGTITRTHSAGDIVVSYSNVKSVTPNGIVSLLVYGVLTELNIESSNPHARIGDRIEVSKPGFETADPILYDVSSRNYRWKVNVNGDSPSVPLNPPVGLSLQKVLSDIGAIYEDDDFYYYATSSYPSTRILTSNVDQDLDDPQLLKIVPKSTQTTSEIYKTPRRDVGILVDGSIAFGYKNEDLIEYGPITRFEVTKKGSGYQNPPFVLLNGESGKALSVLTGDTVSEIISTSEDNYIKPPTVEIVSGRNAVLDAVVTSGEISSIKIVNPGEYYSSPPVIIVSDLAGRGRFAEYRAEVSLFGQITELVKIDGGKFFTQENVRVTVIPDANANAATARAEIREWVKNRYFGAALDDNGGLVVSSFDKNKNYYGVVSNPRRLRLRLSDNITTTTLSEQSGLKTHSPILGYAYDGNPIYGPYAFANPLDSNSGVVRMESGYSLKSTRVNGPVDAPYEMGTFVDDYEWTPTVDTGKTRLDVNNGRFCVTPEFPLGVYAYFMTIDAVGTPVFPYIMGENYYSLPVQSNYQSDVTQSSLPRSVRRLFIPGTEKNGKSEIAVIDSISTGSVSSVRVEDSQSNYEVGSKIYVDNSGTGGSGASGVVSSTFGKDVLSLESKDTKATRLFSTESFYSFVGDIVTQPSTGAQGELIRDVIEEQDFVLRAVTGTFEVGSTIESTTTVLNLLLSQNSTYSKDATLDLVLFEDPTTVLASGTILASTATQNSVRIKVNSGNFSDYLNYAEGETILKSSDLSNTPGSTIVVSNNLSSDITISGVNENIAILETDSEHNFAEGDTIDITIDPDENLTETTYYVSKKKYQEVDLIPLNFDGRVNDTGIGSSTMVGLGRDYVGGVYQDVELIFSNYTNVRDGIGAIGDAGNAKATVTVGSGNFDGSGQVESIVITEGGSGYNTDDVLTISPNDIAKIDPSIFDTDVTATMVQLNGDVIDSYEQSYFVVDPADYADTLTFLGSPGDIFLDDDGIEYVFVEADQDNNRFRYIQTVPAENLTDLDTINGGTAILTIETEFPPGTPYPQFRFDVNGEENPDYDLRVGSTFTINPLPGHSIYIVSDYRTSILEDGIALDMESYTEASGVTNNGSTDTNETITFTPQAPGEYYYICVSHPEAVGTLKVYPSPSTALPLVSVNAVGLGDQRTEVVLDRVFSLSIGDTLSVGSEIVRVTSIDKVTRRVGLERGVNGTTAVNHLANSKVNSYKPKYNFTPGTQIFGTDVNDPYVVSYDEETHRLVVNYGYDAINPREINTVSSFADHGTPEKIASVSKVNDLVDRLEFSLDNVNFLTNPIVDVQKYYFYKFDTSHPSMLSSYLDISTSSNFNVFTEEKEVGLAEPGNPGSFVRIRLGYGANIGNVKRQEVNFTTYYYFLTSSNTDTGGSFLRIKNDPLAGRKTVVYTTDKKLVYNLTDVPQYDGYGNIRYTGKSIGKIASISLDNLGDNYNSMPVIKGVVPAQGFRANIEAIRDASKNNISELSIVDSGKEYSKPDVIITGDGTGLEIELTVDGGRISAAKITNPGSGYLSTPTLDIIETDNKLFFTSLDIGVPQSAKFINNGTFYFDDDSIISSYETPQVLLLSNFDLNSFGQGERIEQRINGVMIASGKIANGGWKKGSNIMRLVDVNGVFREGYLITGLSKGRTAFVNSIVRTSFNPTINTLTRTLGKYNSDRGKSSSANQRITDSFFYQDYSYVVRSRTPINQWRNAVKDTTHPAGFKMFGELYLESEADARMRPDQPTSEKLTNYLILPTTAVSSFTTRRNITTSVIKVEDSRVVRGKGSVSVDSFDETLTRVRNVTLSPAFDGKYDPSTGLKIGNKTFTIIDADTGTAFAPYNDMSLMVTLDGIAQNPGYSYKINGNQITFYEAPLGKRQQNVDGDIVEVPAQSYYIRSFEFRDASDNNRYLKKLKNISKNFDGRTRIFDLFYEDGSIVKTDPNENLMIYLNAVLQQGSYEIRRFNSASKTDQIVFSKAPKNYDDLYDGGVPKQLDNYEYFFGYSIGSFERLSINENLIPYNSKSNFYQILDKNGRIKNFDTPLYAYVFIDGVLQRGEGVSYRVNGPSITFSNPLLYAEQSDGSYVTSKVDILYFYGKDYSPTITAFDFEDDTYFNTVEATLTGYRDEFDSWYKRNTSFKTIAYQIINGVQRVWGELSDIGLSTGDDWILYLRAQNIDSVDNEPVYFTRRDPAGGQDSISLTFDAFSFEYLTSSITDERILKRVEANYIPFKFGADLSDNTDYRGFVIREHPNLRIGDKIQIDGESEMREVFSTPLFAKPKEYRDGQQISNSYYATLNVGAYNKDVLGEGLAVTANVENGVVTSLNWNRRDLQRYFDTGILLNPTAYQYYSPPVLNFVPTENFGGGARAEVVVYGGQIIDLILVDGGSGYTKAPRVVVGRGYSILRNNNYAESSMLIRRTADPAVVLGPKMTVIVSQYPDYQRNLIESTTTMISPNPLDFKEILVCFVTPDSVSTEMPGTTHHERKTTVQLEAENNNIAHNETLIERDNQIINNLTYSSYVNPITKYYQTGALDLYNTPLGDTDYLYSHYLPGTSVRDFIESLYTDVGYADVSGITMEQLGYYFNDEFETITEWINEYQITDSNITTGGRVLNFGLPSMQELASYLDIDLLIGDTVMYIPNTTNFPDSGKLLVGKEIISYTGKLLDRFTGVTRGQNGTTEVDHAAGDILRTIGTFTTA